MFEQRRCQCEATPEDKVPAGLRLDAANALDDVRSKTLDLFRLLKDLRKLLKS